MTARYDREHPAWCAADHRCNLAEHRSAASVAEVPGAGRVILTRVRDSAGREYAEIRMSVVLPTDERNARMRMVSLLTHLRTLIGPTRPLQQGRAAS